VWGNVQNDPRRASFLLGKLIYYVGPRRVVWGTDSLWGGSPQNQIITFRAFQMAREIRDLYNLPHGLDGDIDDPTKDTKDPFAYPDAKAHPERSIRNGILGRNAAAVYRVDADATLGRIECDDLTALRDNYQAEAGANWNEVHGPRTSAGVWEEVRRDPWVNGARVRQNESGFLKRF
jgi:uncharacterized protein